MNKAAATCTRPHLRHKLQAAVAHGEGHQLLAVVWLAGAAPRAPPLGSLQRLHLLVPLVGQQRAGNVELGDDCGRMEGWVGRGAHGWVSMRR